MVQTIWLDNARIIACFSVIFLHISAGFVIGNDVGTEYWWIGNLYDSAVRWCIPVFVMISGALLLDPKKQENLATFYTKRISRILIPIIFWSAFYLTWCYLKGVVKGNKPSIIDLSKKLLSGVPYYHMWFLYMIIGLYLFTPFFRKIVIYSSKKELLIFTTITFVMTMLNSAYNTFMAAGELKLFINWFLLFIPFFFMGIIIRQDNRKPKMSILWCVFTASIIATSYGCYILSKNIGLKYGLYYYDYLSVSVVPMSISFMFILKRWNNPIINITFTRKLSILTLGIYLVHPTILDIVDYMQYCPGSFHPIVSIPVVTFIVFGISAGVVYVIHKIPLVKKII